MLRLRGEHEEAEKFKKALQQIRGIFETFNPYTTKTHDFVLNEAVIGFKVEGYLRTIFDGVRTHLMHTQL